MIGTPTTFVIGAGASHVYGLPLGAKLMQHAQTLTPGSDAYQVVRCCLASRFRDDALGHLSQFCYEVKRHTAPSIDAYLETRADHEPTMQVGRYLIAVLMGTAIAGRATSGKGTEQDWLGYLIQQMAEGARSGKEFAEGNRVRFITFNFDSIIEDRFREDLTNSFRDSEKAIESIVVEHVHGRLPDPPKGAQTDPTFREPMREWVDWAERAAGVVRVVRDDIDPEQLKVAEAAVHSAKVVCFLGFAYRSENLQRLGIPRSLGPEQFIYGSAKDCEEGERLRIQSRVPRIELAAAKCGNRDVLRTLNVLRD